MWIQIKNLDQIGPMSNRPTTFIQKVLPQTRIQIQMEVKWWFAIVRLRLPKGTRQGKISDFTNQIFFGHGGFSHLFQQTSKVWHQNVIRFSNETLFFSKHLKK